MYEEESAFAGETFKASPVGRRTSRSAIRIIFRILLLCILLRKLDFFLSTENPQKSGMFVGNRLARAAAHTNATFQLSYNVSPLGCAARLR